MSKPMTQATGEEVIPLTSVDLAFRTNTLQDSEITPPNDAGSISEEGWFGTIGSDFRSIATCFKNTIPPIIGGVATLVQKSAMSVAAEIAQLEREGELNSQRWSKENGGQIDEQIPSLLPWEIRKDTKDSEFPIYVVDEALMEEVLALSLVESTFLEPFSSSSSEEEDETAASDFVLDDARISVIQRLLDIDENLSLIHARLSGRRNVKEIEFWKNYFHHCDVLRKDSSEGNKVSNNDQESLEKKSPTQILAEIERKLSLSSDLDDSSLVPVSTIDDLSYVDVIASAPNSLNSFVLVGHEEKMKV